MEKGLFNKNKNIIYIFISFLVIVMSICILFCKKYIGSWNEFLINNLRNVLKYNSYKNIIFLIADNNFKYIFLIIIVCKTMYRRYIKYFLAILFGISVSIIVTPVFMSAKIALGFVLLIIILIKMTAWCLSAYILYIKKSKFKYLYLCFFIIIITLLEAFIYLKIVARIIGA